MTAANKPEMPFAEDVPYWRTGRSGAETWMDKAKRSIQAIEGVVEAEGFGCESETGRSAFMLAFSLNGDRFKIIWPVLKSRLGDEAAARRQAATMLYHDVKAKCVAAKVLGGRMAFFCYLELPDGRIAGQLAAPEILKHMPKLLR